jgi:hypothetical protein
MPALLCRPSRRDALSSLIQAESAQKSQTIHRLHYPVALEKDGSIVSREQPLPVMLKVAFSDTFPVPLNDTRTPSSRSKSHYRGALLHVEVHLRKFLTMARRVAVLLAKLIEKRNWGKDKNYEKKINEKSVNKKKIEKKTNRKSVNKKKIGKKTNRKSVNKKKIEKKTNGKSVNKKKIEKKVIGRALLRR